MSSGIFEFGEYSLDLNEKRLQRNGQTVALQPKVFELLIFFVGRPGELITRDELMSAVWKDTFVEESNLRFCIHSLRKSLGKDTEGRDFLETVPKRGYRFVAEVRRISAETAPVAAAETGEVLPTPPETENVRSAKLIWLFGAFIIAAVCFATLAFYLYREKEPTPKNALGIAKLAVLPFTPVGENNPDLEIGLADSLITNLGKIKGLNVLPIASTRQLTDKISDPSAAGSELGADAVLDGSYRFEGAKVRITGRLLRLADDQTLWTETFEVDEPDKLRLEDSISLRTARLISLKIADAEDEQLLRKNKELNEEAIQNYLTARKIWRKNELNRRKEMFGLYEKTIALEPDWALAYAGYAEALLSSDEYAAEKRQVELIARKAIELDKTLPQPHAVLGDVYQYFDWNWAKAETDLRQAVELDPDYAPAHYKLASLLMTQRRFSEAENELQRAVELEPFSPLYHSGLCELYSSDRQFDKALAACLYAKQIEPEFWKFRKLLFWIYVEKEMYQEIDELFLGGLSPAERAKNPLASAVEKKDLRPYWQYAIERPVTDGRQQPVNMAKFYLKLGEREKVIENIETALRQRNVGLPGANADPVFDKIRNDERFAKVMKEIGLRR